MIELEETQMWEKVYLVTVKWRCDICTNNTLSTSIFIETTVTLSLFLPISSELHTLYPDEQLNLAVGLIYI